MVREEGDKRRLPIIMGVMQVWCASRGQQWTEGACCVFCVLPLLWRHQGPSLSVDCSQATVTAIPCLGLSLCNDAWTCVSRSAAGLTIL